MKHLHIFILLIFFASCQPSGREQKTAAVVTDSLAVAIQHIRADLQVRPNDAELRMYLANALIEQEEYAAADSQAVMLAKDSAQLHKAHYVRALIALHKKDTAATIHHLSAAIALQGRASEYEAVMMNADLLRARQSPKAALLYYTLAATIDSTSAEALYGAGLSNHQLGNEKKAAEKYRQAVKISPDYSPAYIALGRYAAEKRDHKAAWAYFNLAAKADPTDADAFYYRGKTFLQLGNRPAGIDDLTKALSFRKNFPAAKALLDSTLANNFQ